MSGLLVRVTFKVPVANLADYEASSLEEAAANYVKWEAAGELDLMQDLAAGEDTGITVEPYA